MLAEHGHGRGTCLCTCLVYAACVVAFVACVNGDEFSVMYLILLHQFCMGMDEARALVLVLCSSSVSPVSSPLLHASILKNDLFLISLLLLCTGMDEARALVRALWNSSVSPVPWPLLHA